MSDYPGSHSSTGRHNRPQQPMYQPPYNPNQPPVNNGYGMPYQQYQAPNFPPNVPPSPYQAQNVPPSPYQSPNTFAPPPGPPPGNPPYIPYNTPNTGYAPPPGPPPANMGYSAPPGMNGYLPPSNPPPNFDRNVNPGFAPLPQWNVPTHYSNIPNNYISTCTGRKKALLIGINYIGTKNQLQGCINDVYTMRDFLSRYWGFSSNPADMVILTDDNPNPMFRPTRQNMLNAMSWLVSENVPGNSLFFHYSGHGGQQKNTSGDDGGMDDTILPLDHQTAGVIIDDQLNDILVKPLPAGVRLTAVMDCCHSGSALDLPVTYYADGRIKEGTKAERLKSIAQTAAQGLMRGGLMNAVMTAGMAAIPILTSKDKDLNQRMAEKGNYHADIIMFSGSKDSETSTDAVIQGRNTGAMTYAFTQVLSQYHSISYGQLLVEVRDVITKKYNQKPQLSSGRYMDMNQHFLI
ncbi:Ca(2+)-dependent cysteine protease [Boothiomyces macroporosus]|uniref:Ca(2+)-dependent cysteine protease n=1 Tax=Boothiomyces macroporosus TaxID=261099 RepID=A0AAD5UKU2_9FUNG|nr:Ca(2+)-dependent cysteine protease [Boothiomyces macroporosus]